MRNWKAIQHVIVQQQQNMQTDPWHGLLPLKPVELTLEEIIECCAKPQSEKDSTRKNCVHSHRKTSKKP